MHYIFYRALSYLVTPLLPLYLKWRAKQGKEEAMRLPERFGRPSVPRPNAPLIWIHAASMGESQSVMPLIVQWVQRYPHARILLTTVTVTSAKHVATRLPKSAFHQYAPLDTPASVRRFLSHWRPDMACFVDSELWPNMILGLRRREIPLVLLNGRISDRSAKRWHKARPLCEMLLTSFHHIFAKSEEDTKRFANLGARDVQSFGNMKFSSPPLSYDSKQMGELLGAIADRPVWLAASTHSGEEEMIGQIHADLREAYDGLLTIIVPRHNVRGDEIRKLLEAHELSVAQRSRAEAIGPSTDVYVADTMGELGIFYRVASIVFIGGSLVPHGGQNPLEAAYLDCAVIYGPYMDNFLEFCQELESCSGALAVRDGAHLKATLETLLRDQDMQASMAREALQVVEKNKHVITRLDDALQPLMQRVLDKQGG